MPWPVLVTPLIGTLSDRHGRRPVIAICVCGSIVGLGIFATTVSLPWPEAAPLPLLLLFVARIIDGISGGTAATAGAVLADISPPERRARAFGLIGVAFGLGFILGPGLGGWLATFNIALPVWVATGFAVLNLLVVLTMLPETHPPEARPTSVKQETAVRETACSNGAQPFRQDWKPDEQTASAASLPVSSCSSWLSTASRPFWFSISNRHLRGDRSSPQQHF